MKYNKNTLRVCLFDKQFKHEGHTHATADSITIWARTFQLSPCATPIKEEYLQRTLVPIALVPGSYNLMAEKSCLVKTFTWLVIICRWIHMCS